MPLLTHVAPATRWQAQQDVSKPKRLAMVAGLMVVAAAVRLYGLDRESLWWDEAYSYWFASQSLASLWWFVPTFELHPPFYYSLLKAVLAFSETEAAMRSLSVAASVATVPVIYALGRVIDPDGRGHQIGVIAALLFALSPINVDFAQQARPYALLNLTIAIGLWAGAWLLSHPVQGSRPWFAAPAFLRYRADTDAGRALLAWLTLTLSAALVLWLHNVSVVIVSVWAMIAVWSAWRRRLPVSFYQNIALAGALILLIWYPHLAQFLVQTEHVASGFNVGAIHFYILTEPIYNALFIKFIPTVAGVPFLLLLAWLGIKELRRPGQREFLLILLGTPVLTYTILVVISVVEEPIIVARSLVWASIPVTVVLAVGATSERLGNIRRGALVITLAFAVWGCVNYHSSHLRGPWRDAANYIASEASDTDLVIAVPNSGTLPLDYYLTPLRPNLTIQGFPAPFPTVGLDRPYPAGIGAVPGVLPKDARALDDLIQDADTVWLVSRYPGLFDPEGTVLTTLEQTRVAVETMPIDRITNIYRFERR